MMMAAARSPQQRSIGISSTKPSLEAIGAAEIGAVVIGMTGGAGSGIMLSGCVFFISML
jgi:hypothetical protein